mmetsp:Transcript_5365/g.8321  ORF Transcript_5365/g.8321 Transcript_5365/m.8321 type:complete len:126 (-) Transcript_5365:677-1054(-)|eukprot:CAMPEP_0184664618 /NCGR_PEP_ID=MMETSP0308-20130426/53690_1 /TAXON_ID=38269 /ORGANISM="Gloeochaete witrockiana, Strain SAG 46.84" /LENGTH=125 /DNA_ID=CAMNT_0027108135 /DNA_START=211 /DNA_END=588 /DNA_ORIENTATION=-
MARSVAEACDEIICRLNYTHQIHLSELLECIRPSTSNVVNVNCSRVAVASVSPTALVLRCDGNAPTNTREALHEVSIPLPFVANDEEDYWSAIHELIHEAHSWKSSKGYQVPVNDGDLATKVIGS